jgi:hypothetical protein
MARAILMKSPQERDRAASTQPSPDLDHDLGFPRRLQDRIRQKLALRRIQLAIDYRGRHPAI